MNGSSARDANHRDADALALLSPSVCVPTSEGSIQVLSNTFIASGEGVCRNARINAILPKIVRRSLNHDVSYDYRYASDAGNRTRMNRFRVDILVLCLVSTSEFPWPQTAFELRVISCALLVLAHLVHNYSGLSLTCKANAIKSPQSQGARSHPIRCWSCGGSARPE